MEIREGRFIPEDIRRKQARVAELVADRIETAKTLRSYRTEDQRLAWWENRLGDRATRSIIANDIEQARLELLDDCAPATVASRLVMAGADLYTVKKLLGHHDMKMTER